MQKEYNFYVYILTNFSKNVFYVGFTNNIIRRMIEHKEGLGCIFSQKYNLKYLVYLENTSDVYSAMEREKEVKKWRREKKITLIKSTNPDLEDLSDKIFQDYQIGEKEIKAIAKELAENYKSKPN